MVLFYLFEHGNIFFYLFKHGNILLNWTWEYFSLLNMDLVPYLNMEIFRPSYERMYISHEHTVSKK